MILLADIGNTRIKWACSEGGRLYAHGDARHDTGAGGLGPQGPCLASLWHGLGVPERLLAVNVAGAALGEHLASSSVAAWGISPEFMQPAACGFGVTNAYREPRALGADRFAALVAARREFAGPVCVIDCGTAITVDVLNGDGVHLGGLIMPGVSLMRRSLARHTHEIGDVLGSTRLALGTSTAEAVVAGTTCAASYTLDRVMSDLVLRLGPALQCVLTGGDATFIRETLDRRCVLIHDLVLRGLAIMAGGDAP